MQTFIHSLYEWFSKYVHSFYSNDHDVQANITLKEVHTLEVAQNCRQLAGHLGLPPADQQLAEIIGLLHDIGRFKQYAIYRTFRDSISENHALLGLKEIAGLELLKQLNPEARACLEFAVAHHNSIAIPANSQERLQLFARLIRDADKLDIFRVLSPTIQPSDGAGYTALFVEGLLSGSQCDYSYMKTADDRKLVRLSWLYDIHYAWTLKRIVEQGYVEELIASLPDDPKIIKAVLLLQRYIQRKINES